MTPPVLELIDLRLSFRNAGRMTAVLHGINLRVRRGEKVALVGEIRIRQVGRRGWCWGCCNPRKASRWTALSCSTAAR